MIEHFKYIFKTLYTNPDSGEDPLNPDPNTAQRNKRGVNLKKESARRIKIREYLAFTGGPAVANTTIAPGYGYFYLWDPDQNRPEGRTRRRKNWVFVSSVTVKQHQKMGVHFPEIVVPVYFYVSELTDLSWLDLISDPNLARFFGGVIFCYNKIFNVVPLR